VTIEAERDDAANERETAEGDQAVIRLVFAGLGWLSAALFVYAASPGFLTHPYRHFRRLRFTLGVIVLPAIVAASVFIITGRTVLACVVGIPAGLIAWIGGAYLVRYMAADEELTPEERKTREGEAPPSGTTTAYWVAAVLALVVATYAVVQVAK
jgi:hypothetical protein